MRSRFTVAIVAVAVAGLTLAVAASAQMIGIYRNSMGTDAQRGQIVKLSGERCARSAVDGGLQVFVGKATGECVYRTPVVGRDLEIVARATLVGSTPKAVKRRAYLALELRAGQAGARYQLLVFPLQRKAQLRKVLSDGGVKYLHIARGIATRGADRPYELRLRAFNVTSGPERGTARIAAFFGRTLLADVADGAAGDLQGRAAGFSVGAVGDAKGATAVFDDIIVRVPSPF